MDNSSFPGNFFTATRDSDGTIRSGCCIPGMVALFVAAGAGIFQLVQILS